MEWSGWLLWFKFHTVGVSSSGSATVLRRGASKASSVPFKTSRAFGTLVCVCATKKTDLRCPIVIRTARMMDDYDARRKDDDREGAEWLPTEGG